MKRSLIILTLLSCFSALSSTAKERWRDSTVFRVNKVAAHAEFTVHEDRDEAIQPIDFENPWTGKAYQSLNGDWDFNWYANPDQAPTDWFAKDSSVTEWDSIPVPGCWQTYGFDRIYYTNTRQPFFFDYNAPGGKGDKGFEDRAGMDNQAKLGFIHKDDVSVGCYRKWVTISDENRDKRVVLRIGAAEAGIGVYVNGQEVGYSQDSMTPAEFDITDYLEGEKNLITMIVYRWTDGSYMEIQDMVRYNGIHRDVYLRFEPKQRIEDIYFVGTPEQSLSSVQTNYEINVSNHSAEALEGARLSFELLPYNTEEPVHVWSETVSLVSANGSHSVKGELTLEDLKLWSPDQPNLYRLITSLVDASGKVLQVTRIDTGFRLFEDRDGNFYLNGQRFFIKGVNRHDHHPKFGRQVTLESMLRDIELMKQNNINTVRTSHYPNDERWYYLCNLHGIALIDEANLESHGVAGVVPNNDPNWIPQAVDRMTNMVERDKNHPSILIWSLGNEQGNGWTQTFDQQYDATKAIDPSRLIMCDRGNESHKSENPLRLDKPDTVTPMYGALSQMEGHVKRKGDKRPFFMCEYRHAMGNAVGALKEVWDYVYANENERLNGGCIWDWVDQGVEATNESGTVYYQYGGDWGDSASSKLNFSMNGLILSDRSETPKLKEVKKCYEPFFTKAVSLEDGRYEVHNRLIQTNLESYSIIWELRENGQVLDSGMIPAPAAAPGKKTQFTIPSNLRNLDTGKEHYLRISYRSQNATEMVPENFEITFSEFVLGGSYLAEADSKQATAPKAETAGNSIIVSAGNETVYSFDKTQGILSSLTVNGKELLGKQAAKRDRSLDIDQALIDNYKRHGKLHMDKYEKLELTQLDKTKSSEIQIETKDDHVRLTIVNEFQSPQNAGFQQVQTWTIDGNGHAKIHESTTPIGKLGEDCWIPRVGLRFQLSKELSNVSYYGLGPHGNYVDRSYGAWMGIHEAKVMDHYIPYGKPQDHGNREAVRWLELTSEKGPGLRIESATPLAMSTLPYTQEELAKATHTVNLPTPSVTELRIAARVSGVGNGSCGPITRPEYQALSSPVEYSFTIIPFAK